MLHTAQYTRTKLSTCTVGVPVMPAFCAMSGDTAMSISTKCISSLISSTTLSNRRPRAYAREHARMIHSLSKRDRVRTMRPYQAVLPSSDPMFLVPLAIKLFYTQSYTILETKPWKVTPRTGPFINLLLIFSHIHLTSRGETPARGVPLNFHGVRLTPRTFTYILI